MEQVTAILPNKPSKRLTLKQKKFTQTYVSNGGNAAAAAREAYDSDYDSAKTIGSVNLDKPIIIAEIDRLLIKSKSLTTDEFVADRLIQSIENGMGVKATQKDSLQAINMLLKVNNSYPGTKSMSMKVSLKGNLSTESVDQVISTLKTTQNKTNELIEDIS